MSDSYVECLVKAKQPAWAKILKVLLKELSVDKIMAKSKRKRVGTYSLDRMEVFAPVYSYHLDNFKNRQVKEKDYSIGEVLQPDGRYAMYYEGGEKILLSPNEELVKVLKNMAPRKVFSE